MPTKYRNERKVAGVEMQEKLRSLKGKSRSDLVPDHKRGPSSPIGMGSHSKKEMEKGRRR
jgi:hypothetical protein